MLRRVGGGMVVLALGLGVAPAWAETLDEVEAKLKKAYEEVKSYSGNYAIVMNVGTAGSTVHSELRGPTEWARRGGKIFMRTELKGKMTMSFGDTKNENESAMLMVCDGEFMWQLSEQMGTKTAMKTKPDPKVIGDVASMFTELKKDHDVKVLDSAKVDGADAFVIEATAKAPNPQGVDKTVFYFRKDIGVMAKMVGKDKDGKETMTVMLSDIKANPDISPDRFKFTPPEGVQVMDMTSMGQP
ncbi:MAG: outer membrane lipoprotein carrier protein LolA [Phycisphaerae bacterium]|nr:outer membrane lipoprotein carrier protein LolA [Phycisphaerae bacterium]MCZ2401183.1 outer membrane lipoprotein carrier protein LolA [Phycisphaerae bacterium]NUQ49934.1 outer membrane lipoprotein carrier protein LolA [Phycisphaerae bacterium]